MEITLVRLKGTNSEFSFNEDDYWYHGADYCKDITKQSNAIQHCMLNVAKVMRQKPRKITIICEDKEPYLKLGLDNDYMEGVC